MDIMSKFLTRKVEHLNSSLYSSVLLWKSKIPLFSVKKIPTQHPASNYKCDLLQVGLKILAINHNHSEEKPPARFVHCYNAIPPTTTTTATPVPLSPQPPSMWLSSSYAFKCTMIGDVLGAESGDCMTMTSEVIMKAEPPMVLESKLMMRKEKEKTNREIPPPITLLRTHNDMIGSIPWAFKRECGEDGRLVIRVHSVRHHDRVEAHREDGRLTMKLVGNHDIQYCEECGDSMAEEEPVEFEDLEFNEEPDADEGLEFEEGMLCWDLREGVAYGVGGEGGGLIHDSDSLWAASGVGHAAGYMGRPASASAHFRPITFVM